MSDPQPAFERAGTAPAAQQSNPPTANPSPSDTGLPESPIKQTQGSAAGRRSHKKSRTGCAKCKARKIKCDERHPACLNCIAHGVECPFLRGSTASSSSGNASKSASAHIPRGRSSKAKSQSHSPIPSTNNLTPNTSTGSIPTPPPTCTSSSTDSPLPLLELELLHNYTTKTYSTLTADPVIWSFWRDDVVQLGLRSCDYVMRAVLAVSALHLAYHQDRPDRRDWYTAQGILLHQKASRSAMRCMMQMAVARNGHGDGDGNGEGGGGRDGDVDVGMDGGIMPVDKDEAASLFVFSMLTMFFALGSPRRSQPDGSFFIGESGFPDWTFLLSGGRSLRDHVLGERGMETVVGPFLAYGHKRYHARLGVSNRNDGHDGEYGGDHDGDKMDEDHDDNEVKNKSSTTTTQQQRTTSKRNPRLLTALRERITSSVTDPDLLSRYTHAIDELEVELELVLRTPSTTATTTTTTTNTNTSDVLDAMVWLWMVSDSLVPLLRGTPTQEAVAIFAHFCVLLKHHDSHWWLQGWGDHLMSRALEILDEEHRGWLEWPIKEMGRTL